MGSRMGVNAAESALGRSWRLAALGLGTMGLLLTAGPSVAQNGHSQPTLDLFPKQAIDSLKETSKNAKGLENDLQSVLKDLDQQMKLYKQSKCKGATGDQGCQELSSQMAKTYGQMLEIIDKKLPEMKQNIEVTRKALEKRLAQQLGRNRTGADLQRILRQRSGSLLESKRTRSSRKGTHLSDRFRQYYKLVSQQSGGAPVALVGARIYLDLEETARLVELTQQQIQRGQILTNLSESFGTVTPQMQKTVSGVKAVMFGETASGGDQVPQDVQGSDGKGGYCSEFNPNC